MTADRETLGKPGRVDGGDGIAVSGHDKTVGGGDILERWTIANLEY